MSIAPPGREIARCGRYNFHVSIQALLHSIRLLFLLTSLLAAGFVWGVGSHPEWVAGADRWFCDRHIEETQSVWEDVQRAGSAPEDGIIRDVGAHLEGLGAVQYGDRRYQLWRDLTIWYVKQARNQKAWDVALSRQETLVDTLPRDMEQLITWVDLLLERGRRSDLEEAKVKLEAIRLSLPTWKGLAEREIQVSLEQKDEAGLALALDHLLRLRASALTLGWQWFLKVEGDGQLNAGPRGEAILSGDGESYTFAIDLKPGEELKTLRLDPTPGGSGTFNHFQVHAFQIGQDPVAVAVKLARGAEWNPGEASLSLRGHKDPQLVLAVPAKGTHRVQVSFVPKKPLPQWVFERAAKSPWLTKRLRTEGYLPEVKR